MKNASLQTKNHAIVHFKILFIHTVLKTSVKSVKLYIFIKLHFFYLLVTKMSEKFSFTSIRPALAYVLNS